MAAEGNKRQEEIVQPINSELHIFELIDIREQCFWWLICISSRALKSRGINELVFVNIDFDHENRVKNMTDFCRKKKQKK